MVSCTLLRIMLNLINDPELARTCVIQILCKTIRLQEEQGLSPITIGRMENHLRRPGMANHYRYFLRLFAGIDRRWQIHIDKKTISQSVNRLASFLLESSIFP